MCAWLSWAGGVPPAGRAEGVPGGGGDLPAGGGGEPVLARPGPGSPQAPATLEAILEDELAASNRRTGAAPCHAYKLYQDKGLPLSLMVGAAC